MKAVLFDLGFTLIKTAPFPEIYRRILVRFGVKVSIGDIVRAQYATESEFDAANYPVNRRKEYWTEYNASLLENLGVQERRIFLAEKIDELWWEYSHLQVYPDVEPTLSKLRAKGLKLGIVSNGFRKDVEHVLEKLRLKRWFDVVVSIDSCNSAKPAKEIFLCALNKLGVQPSEALFIGDSVETDYKGAVDVGIKPFLIDREGKISSQYNKITSLTDLLAIV
ncbi:MAG: HAD family hydrolase [Candidatus Bathyarchaeum sp.]|nr:MAG: HAD family hydrolase [Candidatus Bathyarchaeum sp.]